MKDIGIRGDDIVKRLRHFAKLLGFDLPAVLNEAADEIERLRIAVRAVMHQNDKHGSSLPVPIIEMLREAIEFKEPTP